MPAKSTHPDYDANLMAWLRARDVIAGEDAVKLGGENYLPRLDSQPADEYDAYKGRACFFNAASRTRDGFIGLLFRRDPEVKVPEPKSGVGSSFRAFALDVVLMGTSLFSYCKAVVGEVLAVGRALTLPFLRPTAVHPEAGLCDPASVAAWHAGGYLVNTWTVDAPAQIRALAARGVDGLITNDPAACRRALAG